MGGFGKRWRIVASLLVAACCGASLVPAAPASASASAAAATDAATDTATDCVTQLSCSMEMITTWDVPTRATWFRALRNRLDIEVAPGAGGVFENIQDVLRLSQQKGFDRHPWFLIVDAGIIEGIQAGFADVSGVGSVSPNWGRPGWKRFFEAYRAGRPEVELNTLWGEAEQAATNFGMHRARLARQRLGYEGTDGRIRFALIEVGNTYRQNLARPTTASKAAFWRVCHAPTNPVEFFTGFYLRLNTTICAGIDRFFSVMGPSVILVLGGLAFDNATWLRPLAKAMGLFEYQTVGLWDRYVAVP